MTNISAPVTLQSLEKLTATAEESLSILDNISLPEEKKQFLKDVMKLAETENGYSDEIRSAWLKIRKLEKQIKENFKAYSKIVDISATPMSPITEEDKNEINNFIETATDLRDKFQISHSVVWNVHNVLYKIKKEHG